jgi:hypothetical protein
MTVTITANHVQKVITGTLPELATQSLQHFSQDACLTALNRGEEITCCAVAMGSSGQVLTVELSISTGMPDTAAVEEGEAVLEVARKYAERRSAGIGHEDAIEGLDGELSETTGGTITISNSGSQAKEEKPAISSEEGLELIAKLSHKIATSLLDASETLGMNEGQTITAAMAAVVKVIIDVTPSKKTSKALEYSIGYFEGVVRNTIKQLKNIEMEDHRSEDTMSALIDKLKTMSPKGNA